MKLRGPLYACLFCVIALGGCTLPAGSEQGRAVIKGIVIYRERMAVSPRAVVRVTLEDISRVDVVSTVVAETSFLASGGPPYAFALGYNPAQIDSRNRYSLHATIRLGDQLLFTSTENIPPFEQEMVEILVRRAGGG
jgi:putative lipoprotein